MEENEMEENEIEKANEKLAMLKDEGFKSLAQKERHNAIKRALQEYDRMLMKGEL